jgi:uncharacterized protein YbjQ (UPF0145 family)
MTHDMVTTAFTLDGYRIVQTLGLVRGIVVRSRSIFGTIGAGLQTIVGGRDRSAVLWGSGGCRKNLTRRNLQD